MPREEALFATLHPLWHDESPTAGTGLDKVKFPLLEVFQIIFKIAVRKKGMSSSELAAEFGCREKTAWNFKWKIWQAIKSANTHLLSGEVHVDEFYVGGPEPGMRGRRRGKRKRAVVVLEVLPDRRVGRAYAMAIPDASARSLRPFFEKHISRDATVVTDGWEGYRPLMRDWIITQVPSDDGRAMPQIHLHIMNFKGWLRGIHHHCSVKQFQGYLDEYHFRYNMRNFMYGIFDLLVKRIVFSEPIRL